MDGPVHIHTKKCSIYVQSVILSTDLASLSFSLVQLSLHQVQLDQVSLVYLMLSKVRQIVQLGQLRLCWVSLVYIRLGQIRYSFVIYTVKNDAYELYCLSRSGSANSTTHLLHLPLLISNCLYLHLCYRLTFLVHPTIAVSIYICKLFIYTYLYLLITELGRYQSF